MATVEIPLDSTYPSFTFSLELELVVYNFAFYYNFRTSNWYMGIYQSSGVPIVLGVPLYSQWSLLGHYVIAEKPQGIFYCYDTEGQLANPGRHDLGARVKLLYEEST